MTCRTVLAGGLSIALLYAGQWSKLPPIPAAISGPFAGVSHGSLIVTGTIDGSSQNLFVLLSGGKRWLSFQNPHPLTHGGSAAWNDILILAGGTDGKENFRDVRRLEWKGGTPVFSSLPPLPIPLANCGAAVAEHRLYVFGGQQSPTSSKASDGLFSLDLMHPARGWQTHTRIRGPGRIFPVFVAVGPDLYVFGGAELTPQGKRYLKDGWRFAHGEEWQPLAEPPFTRASAASVSFFGRLFIFGGNDGVPSGLTKSILEFRPPSGTWMERDTLPIARAGAVAVMWRNSVVILGGEESTGQQTARVVSWRPE